MPFVVDASAVVALLCDEEGAARLEELLSDEDVESTTVAYISAVNLAEVHQQLGPKLPEDLIGEHDSVIAVEAFTATHAREAAALRTATRDAGLSLADRACLALAKTMGLTALTADRAWTKVSLGIKLELIR